MQRKPGFVLIPVAMMLFCACAGAQMAVHAMSGTVKAINSSAKTMDVTVESGDTDQFKLASDAKVTLDFDRALQTDSTEASNFKSLGDYVIVYYYGYDNNRTAVAIKDLGKGPFEKAEGTVVSFDKHDRTMTVKDDAGKTASFALADRVVVDTGLNVASVKGYDPHKGNYVRVTYTTNSGKNTAVFIRSRE